ncbi:DoxX family protein [Streptomyces sp. YIM 98790]|uniref:DoxX family protein n=1 Tax=Streptomyces sp. YIM 98790 TaxID=2689077 RepID=UPI00140AD621|nr:DoxX family protein [Streptomyces sp. YIM 98790]
MDVLVLIGRILFVLIFLGSGVNHFARTSAMADYAASKGVPMPAQITRVTGAVQLAGALMVLLGIWADLGALLLAAFVLSTAVVMHRFWAETDPMTRQNDMLHFLKDLGLGGAALMLVAFFSYAGDDLGMTLTGPLFDVR